MPAIIIVIMHLLLLDFKMVNTIKMPKELLASVPGLPPFPSDNWYSPRTFLSPPPKIILRPDHLILKSSLLTSGNYDEIYTAIRVVSRSTYETENMSRSMHGSNTFCLGKQVALAGRM